MFFGLTPYRNASLLALSGWPLTKATTFDFSHFANAGKIWLIERLPRPTIAQPSFFPGGSGTTSCAAEFFTPAITFAATNPEPVRERNPRRVMSLISDLLILTCAARESQPAVAANIARTPASVWDRLASRRFRWICIFLRQISFSSTRRGCAFRQLCRALPGQTAAERNTRLPGHPPPGPPASQSRFQ